MQLTLLFDRITRNVAEKKLIVVVFLNVAKAFDAIWIDDLLLKLMILNFQSYLVQTFSAYLQVRKFEVSFQTATSSRCVICVWVVQGGLISLVLISLYVNVMPTPSHHIELALYANNMVIIAMSHSPTLLVSYLESYLSDLQRWLTEWRIAINASKSTAIIYTVSEKDCTLFFFSFFF